MDRVIASYLLILGFMLVMMFVDLFLRDR